MKLKSLIKFSWKNLWSHRMRAVLTIGGVAIGMAAILFLVSLGFGMERLVTQQVADFEAFTIIDVPASTEKTGRISQDVTDKLKKIPHIVNISEISDLAGRIKLGSQDSTTETVIIAVNAPYFKMAQVNLDSGEAFGDQVKNEVVISKSLAGLLGYGGNTKEALGQTVNLDAIIPQDLRAADSVDGSIVKTSGPLKIVGVTTDSAGPMVYIPLPYALDLGVANRTSLKIKTDNKDSIEVVRKAIENSGLNTEYVGDTVQQITQIFTLFRIVLGGFGLVALVVAALGTFNTLTISLMERIKEVGLLKTLGMNKKGIFQLFIIESFSIGILGGILGIFVGSGAGWLLNAALRYLAVHSSVDTVQIYYTPTNLMLGMVIGSVIIGFLTGLYPAMRAIKTRPLDALRYE